MVVAEEHSLDEIDEALTHLATSRRHSERDGDRPRVLRLGAQIDELLEQRSSGARR